MTKKVCMIIPNEMVKGGIASVVQGYKHSRLVDDYRIDFVESYVDGSKLRKLIKAIIAYISFLFLLLRNKPDLVHIHSAFGPSFYRKLPFIILSRIFNIKIINHIHGSAIDSFYFQAQDWKKFLVKKVYEQCDYTIVLSDDWKKIMSCIVKKERIRVLPNFCPIIEDNTGLKKRQILYMGIISEEKGCFDIPGIVEKVCRECNDCRFVLAGDGNIESVRKELEERGVASNVFFPGWVRGRDKEKLLKESSIFLLPTYHEGMPMSVLEAMGYGLAIISTMVGGIPAVVEDKGNGYLCNPGDISQMSACLLRLLNNPHLCMEMGNESIEIIKKKFSIEAHIESLEQIYDSLLF